MGRKEGGSRPMRGCCRDAGERRGAQAEVVALKVVESGQILNMKLFLTLNIF